MKPKMKVILLVAVLSLASLLTVSAQESDREVYPEQVSIEHNEAVKNFSSDFVSSFPTTGLFDNSALTLLGVNNLAALNVQGSENLTVLNQQGYGIFGGINILGDSNKASLSQSGSDLMSILDIRGDYNIFDMTQQGIGLKNIVFVLGSGLQFDALHTNAGFELNQVGAGSIPLSIEQKGTTVPIIIENN